MVSRSLCLTASSSWGTTVGVHPHTNNVCLRVDTLFILKIIEFLASYCLSLNVPCFLQTKHRRHWTKLTVFHTPLKMYANILSMKCHVILQKQGWGTTSYPQSCIGSQGLCVQCSRVQKDWFSLDCLQGFHEGQLDSVPLTGA